MRGLVTILLLSLGLAFGSSHPVHGCSLAGSLSPDSQRIRDARVLAIATVTELSGSGVVTAKLKLDRLYRNGAPERFSVKTRGAAACGFSDSLAVGREVEVAVRRDRGNVLVAVRDDGSGGARITPGSGLSMLCDRVHALGGRLSLHSPPLGGTVMTAEIPCGS